MMKELCLIEVEKFSSLRFPDPCLSFFYHNLIFIWIFGVKLVLCESRLKDISNDIWISKIGFKMRKLWPYKIGIDFQT